MSFRKTEIKKYIHSLQDKKGESPSPQADSAVYGKASPCAFKLRGSLTVECALVLFFFFMGMATIISFMDFFQTQMERQSRLKEKAQAAALEFSDWENAPADVELPEIYVWSPPVSLFRLPPVAAADKVKVHTWTGYEGKAGTDEKQEMVYIARNGQVYHQNSDCTYLRLSIEAVAMKELDWLRNSAGKRYTACGICSEEGGNAAQVYITESGDKYHSRITCSGLKRTVLLVPKSQVRGWSACSRCGG